MCGFLLATGQLFYGMIATKHVKQELKIKLVTRVLDLEEFFRK